MATCTTGKHSACFVCVRTYVQGIVGQGKYLPKCMDSDCKNVYAKTVLRPLLEQSVMDRLERLEQNRQLKNIPGIEECPFCNFKGMQLESNVFDCLNPECEVSSCRHCKELSHVPRTCDEAKKDKSSGSNLNIRHLLEEAMSRAAMRVCHMCKTKFVKEEGCNLVSHKVIFLQRCTNNGKD
jgi:TRIAD3 protein (E3 ubiquitin-protein ligase RNF216)